MNALYMPAWFIIAAPILAGLGGLLGAALVQNWKPARDLAIGGADYVQAVREAVEYAERYGVTNALPGTAKLAIAIKQMDDWLDGQNVHGDAKKVTLERVHADIELARLTLFPKK